MRNKKVPFFTGALVMVTLFSFKTPPISNFFIRLLLETEDRCRFCQNRTSSLIICSHAPDCGTSIDYKEQTQPPDEFF